MNAASEFFPDGFVGTMVDPQMIGDNPFLKNTRPGMPKRFEPWWERVKRLRSEGLLDEAITVAERDGDIAEALLVQSDLHAERMLRARTAGQLDVAREAWKKASDCAYAYAASATSGGEGAARSLDRDRILAALGPEPT